MQATQAERYGAVEKCRAVLAAWTERKPAAVLCRELEISAALFCQWQDRALSGMLQALEPRGKGDAAQGPALPTQFKRLLERTARARELEALGRNAHWRPRPARSKATPPTPAPATDS